MELCRGGLLGVKTCIHIDAAYTEHPAPEEVPLGPTVQVPWAACLPLRIQSCRRSPHRHAGCRSSRLCLPPHRSQIQPAAVHTRLLTLRDLSHDSTFPIVHDHGNLRMSHMVAMQDLRLVAAATDENWEIEILPDKTLVALISLCAPFEGAGFQFSQ